MNRSWWENEDILQQFRHWLTRTGDELGGAEEAIDETITASADAAIDLAGGELEPEEPGGGAQPVAEAAPAVKWSVSQATQVCCDTSDVGAAGSVADLPVVGLRQLVEAFTALRHEAKLQTKSTRGLEDAVQAALQGLDHAKRQFQAVQAREQESAERAARPFVEALVGLDEALSRAVKAFAATHRQMTEAAPAQLLSGLDERFRQLPAWRRWLASPWHAEVRRKCCDALVRTTEGEFAGLMEGFQLIQARLERTLRECGIQRLETVGRRADPSLMTVIELVEGVQGEPETVVEEVRPGYLWKGMVVRFAEVRVARGASAGFDLDEPRTENLQEET
jgi:molecular chaperone GrpE